MLWLGGCSGCALWPPEGEGVGRPSGQLSEGDCVIKPWAWRNTGLLWDTMIPQESVLRMGQDSAHGPERSSHDCA